MGVEKRRILLAEIKPRVPQPPSFGTWNPADKDASIALSNGNLTATKNVVHATAWGCVRCNTPIRPGAGQAYWETTYAYTSTANLCAAVAINSAPLTTQPGNEIAALIRSVAGPLKNGDCYMDGNIIANVGAVATGTVIRHWLDLDSGTYRIANGGGAWVTLVDHIVIGLFGTFDWNPFAGFLRPTGSTCSITANFGATPFVYAVPDGVNAGVASYPAPAETTVYLASEKFNTGSLESPASTEYLARIAGDQDVEVERDVSCWVWGGQTQSRRGQLVLINKDGGLDDWFKYEWRDASVVLYSGYEGDNRAAFTRWSTGVVDNFTPTANRRILITLADLLAQLDRPIQTSLYPDTQANATLAGQPIPIVLGRPLYCEPALLDTSTLSRNYQLHDGFDNGVIHGSMTQIDAAYDRGDVFAAPPTDWTYYPSSLNKLGFHLVNAPVGKIVANPVGPARGSSTVIEYLPEMIEYVFARSWNAYGAAAVWNVDWTAVQALDAKAHYRMAVFLRDAKTMLALLREIMDCYCGWVVPRLDGTISVGRVEEPSSTPVLTLNATNVKSVVPTLDEAKGLTQRLAGRRNNSPHTDPDLVSTVSGALRQELKAIYTCIRQGAAVLQVGNNAPLSGAYAHALTADPKATMLQEAAHLLAEANRICTLWRATRNFYGVEAILGASAADTLEPGQTVRLVWPYIKGLQLGLNLFLKRVKNRFFSRGVSLTLWGRPPA